MTRAEIKKYIADEFGFSTRKIVLLEADQNRPWDYAMFEVCDLQYQIRDGVLTIYE